MKIETLEPGSIFVTAPDAPTEAKESRVFLKLKTGAQNIYDGSFLESDLEPYEIFTDDLAQARGEEQEAVDKYVDEFREKALIEQAKEEAESVTEDENEEAPKSDRTDFRKNHNHSYHLVSEKEVPGVKRGYYRMVEGDLHFAPEINGSVDRTKVEQTPDWLSSEVELREAITKYLTPKY